MREINDCCATPLEGCGARSTGQDMATIPYVKNAVHDLRDLKKGKSYSTRLSNLQASITNTVASR